MAPARRVVVDLNQLLDQLPAYKDPNRMRTDVSTLARHCPTLVPSRGTLTSNTGDEEEVLVLNGTVPIAFRGARYEIPVEIFVTGNYPSSPPTCYVRPTKGTSLKRAHPCVDDSGLVSIPYLEDWAESTHRLVELCAHMSDVFGSEPPVFTDSASDEARRSANSPSPSERCLATVDVDQLVGQFSIYHDPDHVKQELVEVSKHCPTLVPKRGTLTSINGEEEDLLVLEGTVRAKFVGAEYATPVEMFLGKGYPWSPPTCYIRPKRGMILKRGHQHVDQYGMLYLPYLHDWEAETHNLVDLSERMSNTFGEEPPLYTESLGIRATPEDLDQLVGELAVYEDPDRVKEDALNVLREFPTLAPRRRTLTCNDSGEEEDLLVLEGALEASSEGEECTTPIEIYIRTRYPRTPPTCYIRPTEGMAVKRGHQQVDQNGTVYVPYLHDWDAATHNLVELSAQMLGAFEEEPPLYTDSFHDGVFPEDLDELLGDLEVYQDPSRLKRDAVNVLRQYRTLVPVRGMLTLNTGEEEDLFLLKGTIPTFFRGKNYATPVEIYLRGDYPKVPPTCYVRPTAGMMVKRDHQHVDQSGLVDFWYLQDWEEGSHHLLGLCALLSDLFGAVPPVFAKAATNTTWGGAGR